MATKGYIEKKNRDLKREINDNEIRQRERESKRAFVGDIISSVTGGLTRLGSSGISAAAKAAEMASKAGRTMSKSNSVEWYKRWISDISNFVNLPQYNNVHLPLRGTGVTAYSSGTMTAQHSVPGIMSIGYIPYLGVQTLPDTGTPVFPLNIALARDITQIRKANARSVSRNPDELGFYWLTCVEIATLLADLKSALEICLGFSGANTYMPKTLLAAKGWDYDMVYTNRAELKKIYQEFALRFNSNIVIPADFALLKRRVWLVSVVVKDANLRRGQLYVFNPLYYQHVNADEDALAYYDASGFVSSGIKYTVAKLRAWLYDAFESLEESVTFVDLVADIRSAIPEAKFAKLPLEISNDVPVYAANDEVLEQIHNMDTLPEGTDGSSASINNLMAVTTDGTYLKTGTGSEVSCSSATELGAYETVIDHIMRHKRVLDSYEELMSGDRVLTSTRLKITGWGNASATAPNMVFNVASAGTEICRFAKIYYYDAVANTDTSWIFHTIVPSTQISNGSIAKLMSFDWHPLMYIATLTNYNTFTVVAMGEFGNAFTVEGIDLSNIHKICIESLSYLDDSVFTAAFGK